MKSKRFRHFFYAIAFAIIAIEFLMRPSIALSSPLPCQPFQLYPEMPLPPVDIQILTDSKISTDQWIDKISRVPGHSKFAEQIKGQVISQSQLQCLYHWITTDIDKDGVMDWQVSSEAQSFKLPIPLDNDWDNDGISNLWDSQPYILNGSSNPSDIPNHLKLEKDVSGTLNILQQRLFREHRLLLVNHTESHSLNALKLLERVAKALSLKSILKDDYLVIYGFSGLGVTDNQVASYFPELQSMAMSARNLLSKTKESEISALLNISHEIGHHVLLKNLELHEVVTLAKVYGSWRLPRAPKSYFDQLFFEPFTNDQLMGYFPSPYSQSNIHEWFSEAFAHFTLQKIYPDLKAVADFPDALARWLNHRLGASKRQGSGYSSTSSFSTPIQSKV